MERKTPQGRLERIKQWWAELTKPYPTDEELEQHETERRILWRKVDQLEAENAFLRRELRRFTGEISVARNEVRRASTDLDRALIDSYGRMEDATLKRWRSDEPIE